MKVFDIYSKRQKRLIGEVSDVYQYDVIPQPLRVQIVHIIKDVINPYSTQEIEQKFLFIHDILCREHGILSLHSPIFTQKSIKVVLDFMLETKEIEQVLDIVELIFKSIEEPYNENDYIEDISNKSILDEAIEELNFRFREHGLGYQYESGEIIRVDSQIIHAEAVKPVLHLLSDPQFQGANEEFLKAHEHYRHGNYKECLNECLKAFESTMKIICNKQGWSFKPTDTAKTLINICFQNNLIPNYLETQFSSLRQNFESGIPTIRNKLGGHGQGSQPVNVPQYFAAYQLHITASTILFLIEADKSLP
ncbi:hypothetical protein H6G54_21605 [Anabaena cylindrica FACHB-243]|uniref:Abortive infection protein-like C-terminal domain-containing protein n=1 Tax=Anabaena cylindrica (strain ATCC 27899 / PCC 7122) TaxID=272123 RepID=K9ZBL7_ANACC|nr:MULTISPECIES: hypothetical protein [Anabaena]AFZ55745.1 hypothetical protein Anacy_0136 [Anabaena cylindrica PCC 7122]MBD2420254.1 hypothetical protein [Anabaena cylindrica FACHB-243]MBY5282133.1 hypothetical protein [Anabaena sp. CCAP 1446/1C]MBY5309569.1 hypothetical protein [Anabaena sp. CCAP 1446/1C]MCM2406092.1 hypothetical protein [Anabaena sp. CCAP 1446/1C]